VAFQRWHMHFSNSRKFVLSSTIALLLLQSIPAQLRADCPYDWQPPLAPPAAGGPVETATTWDPDGPGPARDWLVVAGYASPPPTSYINAWNGTSWQSLGTGTSGPVFAVQSYGGELVAAGRFDFVDGLALSGIARWNGTSWSPLASGITTWVYALTIYNSELIVGGLFSVAGGVSARNIARWNGSEWQPLGAGLSGAGATVYAVAVHDGDLYAGGEFAFGGGPNASRCVGRWNGTNWEALGTGMQYFGTPTVRALASYNGELIAAGSFNRAGSVFANNIARWNGTSWNTLADGVDLRVEALAVYQGELFACGTFLNAGGAPASRIARWNGSNWQPLGSGLNNGAYALTTFNGELIVGGDFTTAGNTISAYLARWGPTIQPPAITQQPAPRKLLSGATATFTVAASGGEPLNYQWRKNTQPLTDDGRILGANSDALTITNINLLDTANYDCLIANDCGQALTTPARLSVVRAVISPLSVQDVSD